MRIHLASIALAFGIAAQASAGVLPQLVIDARFVATGGGPDRILASPRMVVQEGMTGTIRTATCGAHTGASCLVSKITPVAHTRHGWLLQIDLEPEQPHASCPPWTAYRMAADKPVSVTYAAGSPATRLELTVQQIDEKQAAELSAR